MNLHLAAPTRLLRAFLLSLLLGGTLTAQTILRPEPDQAHFPINGGRLVVQPIPGALCELTVREGAWDGKVVLHRAHMQLQTFQLDGLKRHTTYAVSIRIHGRETIARVRFFTGPHPPFGADLPALVDMVPGMPVVITANTWGTIDHVAWIDSNGRTLSTTETLNLPSGPNVAGVYTFVVTGPGRADRIPISVREMTATVPLRLNIQAGESGLMLAWPSTHVVRNEPGHLALEHSQDLIEWRPVATAVFQPVLVGDQWTVNLPTIEANPQWGFFRIASWAGNEQGSSAPGAVREAAMGSAPPTPLLPHGDRDVATPPQRRARR